MTLVRDHAEIYLECEDCPETTSVFRAEEQFDEMIYEAKGAGWLIERISGEYEHRCPGCRNASRLEAARRKFGI